jgi:hypothetical protein
MPGPWPKNKLNERLGPRKLDGELDAEFICLRSRSGKKWVVLRMSSPFRVDS